MLGSRGLGPERRAEGLGLGSRGLVPEQRATSLRPVTNSSEYQTLTLSECCRVYERAHGDLFCLVAKSGHAVRFCCAGRKCHFAGNQLLSVTVCSPPHSPDMKVPHAASLSTTSGVDVMKPLC